MIKSQEKLSGGVLLGATVVGLLANSLPAQAQQTEIDALRQQIIQLQERLDKLETTQKQAAEANKTAPVVTSKLPIAVTGLLQVNTRGFFNQKGPGATNADTFQIRRGEIRITGNITPRINGTVMIDPAKQLSATSTSTVVPPPAGSPPGTLPTVVTTVTPNQANNPLQEVMLSYLLNKRDKLSNYIDIGQYKIPIGYEGDLVSSGAIPTVDRGLIFLARDPFGGGNGDIRESGVRLRGTAGPLDYQIGVFNGLGERQNALALSDQKAIVGRLIYSPTNISGLQLGISAAQGNNRGIPTAAARVRRDVFNAFANYKRDKWTFRTEYLTGDNQALAAAPGVVRDVQGYYGLLGYAFNPKLEGVLRYDSFDFDKNLTPAAGLSGDTTVNEIVLGLNYYIKGNNAKIQANLVKRNGGAGLLAGNGFGSNATAFSKSGVHLRTNFQVAF